MIVREPESQFIPAPAGVHAAVCVDEIDLGMVMRKKFGSQNGEKEEKRMVRLVWQIGEDMEDGKPFLIRKDYTASLHEKAGLRKDLECWRGRPFTFDELVGFDLENIIGAPAMINVIHKAGQKGGVFANIAAIMPIPKGMVRIEPRDYIRFKDRAVAAVLNGSSSNGSANHEPEPEPHAEDDDVPF